MDTGFVTIALENFGASFISVFPRYEVLPAAILSLGEAASGQMVKLSSSLP